MTNDNKADSSIPANNDPKAKADNSGDPANAEAAKAYANDDSTQFAKADPVTVDRGDMEGVYDVVAETDRLREQVIKASEPGTDPDSKRRLAKHLAAAGEKVPSHLRTDKDPRSDYPYDTDSDKLKDAGIPDVDNDGNPNPHAGVTTEDVLDPDKADTKANAAKARKASSPTRTTTPQGRSATPTEKA